MEVRFHRSPLLTTILPAMRIKRSSREVFSFWPAPLNARSMKWSAFWGGILPPRKSDFCSWPRASAETRRIVTPSLPMILHPPPDLLRNPPTANLGPIFACANLLLPRLCRDGGTGRRSGLKKLRWLSAPNGEVLFFLSFPAHRNVGPKSNVRFGEVWNGAVRG